MRSYHRPILVRGLALAALMVLGAGLAGCGQSGPLYLPDHPPESQKPRAQRNPAPAPAVSTPAVKPVVPAAAPAPSAPETAGCIETPDAVDPTTPAPAAPHAVESEATRPACPV